MRPVGKHTVYPAEKIELPDNNYSMMSWNVQGKAAQKRRAIKRLIARHSLDSIALQEVYGDDVAPLRRSFKAWTIIDSPADRTRHRSHGGYSNILMVRGSEAGAVKSSTVSQPYHFEQRSAVMAESPVFFGSDVYDVVFGTTHIGRGRVSNKEQFPKAVAFIRDSTKDDASVLVCGDFNRGVNTTKRYFGEKWSITHTDNTTPSGHKVDFCLSQNKGDVTITSAVIDRSEETDHYPLVITFAPTKIDVGAIVGEYIQDVTGKLVKRAYDLSQDSGLLDQEAAR